MDLVLEALRRHLPAFEVTGEAVNCHHNYVERETHYGESVWLTRKGAMRAMGRNQARKRFSVADLERQTEGVLCRKDKGVLDEIPGAYKDIDAVMANQSDLVEVVHTLKQVLCVKG